MAGFGVLWCVWRHEKAILKPFCLLLCVLILEGCGERQGGKTPNSQATGSQTQGSGRQGVLSYEIGDAGVTITDCEEAAFDELVMAYNKRDFEFTP